MRSVIACLSVLFLIIACNATSQVEEQPDSGSKNAITLSGNVGYPQEGMILLEGYSGNQFFPADTIKLREDYTFEQKVNINPGYYRLNFYNKQLVNLILNQDNVRVNVDGNSRTGFAEVSGSRDHDLINQVQKAAGDFSASAEVARVNQEFNEARNAGDEEKMKALQGEYAKLDAAHKRRIGEMINNSNAHLAAIELLQSGRFLDKDQQFEVYKSVANKANTSLPQLPMVQQFVAMVESMKKLAIGQVAPEIALPNPDGEIIKLSSLRGNYVLVDFWAKWCKPCRMENPNVVRMYNKYNEKGFEVYGVSLDRSKEDWLRAIEEDRLRWTQVSDLKFWQSEAARTYNVTAIPFALLLDPEGKIIGKNLRGAVLEAKLAELFGS